LFVDPDFGWRASFKELLTEAGYVAESAATFEEAVRQMSLDRPDLIVTAARLGPFNGLHLVIRYHAEYPDMPIIVTSDLDDAVLRDEVRRYGARFVKKPINRKSFVRLVAKLVGNRGPLGVVGPRRWPRKHAELTATVSRASGRVVDLSYGGLRLEFEGLPIGFESPIHIDLPGRGLSFTAYPRWTMPTESGSVWWCGAEIAPTDREPWQSFVDSV
jgi:DNA-binding response OmpR family regulator